MFFPACERCKSKNIESAEDDRPDQNVRQIGRRLTVDAMAGHPHPVAKALVSAIVIGRAIYKRWPGGGEKRCLDCDHHFH